jgi:hypothetical protein
VLTFGLRYHTNGFCNDLGADPRGRVMALLRHGALWLLSRQMVDKNDRKAVRTVFFCFNKLFDPLYFS